MSDELSQVISDLLQGSTAAADDLMARLPRDRAWTVSFESTETADAFLYRWVARVDLDGEPGDVRFSLSGVTYGG